MNRMLGNDKKMMMIYKYMPTDRFFDNFKFRFTPAQDLNDPRELIPDIRLKCPDSYVNDIVQRNIASAYFRILFEHPHINEKVALQKCLAAAGQFVATFDHATKVREIYDTFMRVTNRNVGVLSLTEAPDNELMWAHYANSNTGFVVGLDMNNAFFQPKANEPKLCGQLMSVQYSDVQPIVLVDPGKLDIPKEIFFTKTTKWSYEREWRMIKHLNMADEVVSKEGKNIHLFEVPPDAIKEIIFGMKVTPETSTNIKNKLRPRFPHIVFKQASFDVTKGIVIS